MIAAMVIFGHKFLNDKDGTETCVMLAEDPWGRDHAMGLLLFSQALSNSIAPISCLELSKYLLNLIVKVEQGI